MSAEQLPRRANADASVFCNAEHLAAVEIMQLKHIIILQNKIDLIDETKATTQHDQIQSFIQVGCTLWFSGCWRSCASVMQWACSGYLAVQRLPFGRERIWLERSSF